VSFGGITFDTSAGDVNLFTNPSLSTGLGYVLNWVTTPSGVPGPFTRAANYSVTAVPEPRTWAMIALGFAGLGLAGRRTAISIA